MTFETAPKPPGNSQIMGRCHARTRWEVEVASECRNVLRMFMSELKLFNAMSQLRLVKVKIAENDRKLEAAQKTF